MLIVGTGWCDFLTGRMCNKLDTGRYSTTISRRTGTVNLVIEVIVGIRPSKLDVHGRIGDKWVQCGGKDRGHCDTATLICQCNADHYGADCMLQTCPTGRRGGEPPGEGHDLECSTWASAKETGFVIVGKGSVARPAEMGRHGRRRAPARPACVGCGARPRKRLCWRAAGLTYGAATQQSPATGTRGSHLPPRLVDGFQPADGPVGWVSGVHTANDDFVGGWTGYDCSLRRCPSATTRARTTTSEIQTVRFAARERYLTVSFRGLSTHLGERYDAQIKWAWKI